MIEIVHNIDANMANVVFVTMMMNIVLTMMMTIIYANVSLSIRENYAINWYVHRNNGNKYIYIRFKIMIERAKGLPLTYIIGPIMALLLVVALFGCCAFGILMAKSKRATHGTYSPSRQELSGARVHMNTMMKPPPEERLI